MSAGARPIGVSHKPGVYYATNDNGIELPVVDVTHPEFALSVGADEQRALLEEFVRRQQPFSKLPMWLRKTLMSFFLRRSVLARALGTARGTFLSGLNTYLLKLGPNNLDAITRHPVDRRIAESVPVLSIRLRLQDVAELLASALAPALAASPASPLHLFNIAGGPAVDSLNALILLKRDAPATLAGRRILISVLDLDSAGPSFGQRALQSLSAPGAPLHGLEIEFRHIPYNWTRASDLGPLIDAARRESAVIAVSSEGGLFDYGSDEEITANLQQLREAVVVVGSVTRGDTLARRLLEGGSVPVRPRGLENFGALVGRAGWRISRAIERPINDQVALIPAT